MKKNTILILLAGVGAYLIWKNLKGSPPTSGVGRTVDWARLPVPGMSMGSGHPWIDQSIGRRSGRLFSRTGRIA